MNAESAEPECQAPLVSDVARSDEFGDGFNTLLVPRTLSQVFKDVLEEADRAETFKQTSPGLEKIAIYFDAAQVRAMVLGMYSFEQTGAGLSRSFNVREFSRERSLVQALATAGSLGRIQMLPPHQAEYEHLKRFNFGVKFEPGNYPRAMAQWLVRSILENDDIQIKVDAERHVVDDETLWSMVDRCAVRQQFQFLQSIRGGPSFSNEVEETCLGLRTYTEAEFMDLLADPLFAKLLEQFEAAREGYPQSNVADAMAFVSLARHVRDYVDGKTEIEPRYFVAEGSKINSKLELILKKSGAWPALHYKPSRSDEGEEVCVLKTWDYFLVKAMVDRKTGEAFEPLDAETASESSLESSFGFSSAAAVTTFDRLSSAGNRRVWTKNFEDSWYRRRINDVMDAAFLDTVLKPFVEQHRAKALSILARNQEMYDKVLRMTTPGRHVDAFAFDTFVRISDIWWVFANLKKAFAGTFRGVTSLRRRKLWFSLRVGHFMLPKKVEKRVTDWVQGLLTTHESHATHIQDLIWREILEAISQVEKAKVGETDDVDLASVVAMLMMGRDPEFYKLALELLDKADDELNWVFLMRWYARIKVGNLKDWKEDLASLEFRARREPALSMKLAAAIAFGTLADAEGFQHSPSKDEVKELWDSCERMALSIVRSSAASNEQLATAWNIVLHGRLARKPWNQPAADEAAKNLKKFEAVGETEESSAWQFIFDGTLAQYYIKKAVKARNASEALLDEAKHYLERAKRGPWAAEYHQLEVEMAEVLALRSE